MLPLFSLSRKGLDWAAGIRNVIAVVYLLTFRLLEHYPETQQYKLSYIPITPGLRLDIQNEKLKKLSVQLSS